MARNDDATFVSILPSFKGFFQEVESKSAQAGKSAGQTFAVSMERNLERAQRAADKAAGVLERAQNRAADSADSTRVAELKLQEVREKSTAKASEIAAAEARVEKARRAQESANKAVEKAAKSATAAQDSMKAATADAAEGMDAGADKVGRFSKETSGLSESLKGGAKNLGAFAAGLAGVAGMGAVAMIGKDVAGSINAMNNQLGYTGAAAEMAGQSVSEVMRSGIVPDAQAAADVVGSLESQFKYLGFEGEQTAAALSDNFAAFSQTFGVEVAEATQTAGQLIKNGLAPDVETAADLMTTAMQRVPAQMRGELPEIINEYGTNFRALGFSGEEAFGLLVSAAEKGKWALDKTGDALKEFTIRGSDMSSTSVAAFEKIGLNAQDMSSKIASGGAGARQALQDTANGILAIEDPAERANTAIALFGTPLEDLSVDQIPDFLSSLSTAGGEMDGFAGSSQKLADNIKNSLDGRLNALRGTVQTLAGEAFMRVWDVVQNKLIPAFSSFAGWVEKNQSWILPLTAAVGAAAGVWALWTGAIAAWNMVTKIATGVQRAFNAVMAANPIMLAVMAVAALVAGLVVFFTKTETGKKIWQGFMDKLSQAWTWLKDTLGPVFTWIGDQAVAGWNAIKSGWDILWNAISIAWTGFIKPVLDGFMMGAKLLAAVVLTILITPVMLAWNLLSAAFMWGWNTLIKPAWDAMKAAALFLWNSVLMPVFGWIQSGWNLLLTGMKFLWESVLKPTWDAIQFAANWLWTSVLMPIFGFIKTGWDNLLFGMKFVWDTILKPTWDAINFALTWMWNSVFSPILGWIGDRWRDMANGIRWVKDNIIQPTFDAIGRGLDTVKGWFKTAVDAIGRTWNRVKELTAKPIKFVVDTVFNNGIRKAWNAVVGFIGMDDKKMNKVELGDLGKYASGGVLPGYTPGRDPHEFFSPTGGRIALSGGEAIMRPEWTRAVGGPAAVERMNRDARRGKITKHGRESAAFANGGVFDLGAFASGGIIGAMTRIVQQKYPMLQMTSGLRPGDGGNHGAGLAADFSNGTGNTPAQLALARDIAKTYPNSMELIYDAPGWSGNIKNGQNVGAFGQFYTMAQAGPHHHHVHWAMNTPPTMPFGGGVFAGGSSGAGGGGGFFDFIGKLVKPAWDKVINAIPKYDKSKGWAAEVPGAFLKKGAGMVWDFVKEKASLFGGSGPGYSGPVGAGVEQWRGLVKKILQDKGLSLSFTNSTLRRMNQESGGNPRAINNWDSNAAAGTPSKGLMQVIDPTFAAHKDPGYDDIWDPESNIRASMNYALSRYGSLPAAYDRAGGYDSGGYLQPGVTRVQNDSGKPEPVFSHAQWKVIRQSILSKAESQQWGAAVDEMAKAAELFANGAREISARAQVDSRRWAAGEHVMLTDDSRLATPQEMVSQIGYWFGSELAGEIGGIFGLDQSLTTAAMDAAGLVDPKLDTSGRVQVQAETVEVTGTNEPADPAGLASVPDAPKSTVDDPVSTSSNEDSESSNGGGYNITIENLTIQGGASEDDGRAFIRGIRDEVDGVRVRGRLSRVN